MPYCSQCQIIHGEEHRFCQRCGQLLKGYQNASARPCARCSTLTFPGQKFCTECGLPLRTARIPQEEEPMYERPPLFYPRRPEPPRRRGGSRRFGRLLSFIAVIVIALGALYVWRQLPVRVPGKDKVPTVAAPQEDLRREVEKISEKIRSAHLNKDINKWTSCYNSAYPNLGQLEAKMLELWKNFDIKEVSYRISNVQALGDKQVAADIVWNIQVYDHRTHDYTLVRQNYKIILEKSPAGWKIRDSKEEGGS
jgi:RNA polymerase subunit RPABC4/transcription elongation factor Spt4